MNRSFYKDVTYSGLLDVVLHHCLLAFLSLYPCSRLTSLWAYLISYELGCGLLGLGSNFIRVIGTKKQRV